MAKIDGKYYITVEDEAPTFNATITDQPVEKGVNITDHVQKGPATISLSGRVVGPQASEIKTYLKAAYENGRTISYVGRNAFKGLITAFSTSHSYEIANGYTFTMELREIDVVKTSSYVGQLPAPIRVQAAVINSGGLKQTKSKSGSAKKKASEKPVEKVKFKAGSKWADK